MNLPLFQLKIEDLDKCLTKVSIVDNPAIEENYFKFSKNIKMEFKADNDRRIVSGPAMIPDMVIYQKDENGEYNVFFDKATIELAAQMFMKNGFNRSINEMHTDKLSNGSYYFECFISDASRGILPMKGFEHLPDGTLFLSAKIEDENTWNKVVSGEYKGFSIEGMFMPVNAELKALMSLLESDITEENCEQIFQDVKNILAIS